MSSFLPSFRPFFVKYNSPFQKKGPQPLKSGLLRGNHFQQTLIGEFTKLTQLLSTSFIAKNVDCRLSCQTRYYYYFLVDFARKIFWCKFYFPTTISFTVMCRMYVFFRMKFYLKKGSDYHTLILVSSIK